MKKSNLAARYVFFAIIFMAGLSMAKTLRHTSQQTVNLTEDDSDKSIIVSMGTAITLKLPDQADGGYRLDSLIYNLSVTKLVKRTTIPPEKNKPGAHGTGIWQFIAIARGRSEFKLTATRPWKGGATVTIFDDIVTVK